MNIYISISLCFIPLVLCLVLFKLCSKIRISTELVACLAGLVAVLPISFIQFLIVYYFPNLGESGTHLFPLFLKTLVINGVIEEGLKLVFLLFIPRKHTEFPHYFMAALLLGLSLGCFESVVYFLQHLQSAKANGAELIYHLIFMRMTSSVLVHTFCSGLLGIFIWSVKEKNTDIFSLVFPILIHALYDFFAGFSSWIQWFSVAAILAVILESRIRYEKNKPAQEYKKDSVPSKSSADKTIETPLKDAPTFNE